MLDFMNDLCASELWSHAYTNKTTHSKLECSRIVAVIVDGQSSFSIVVQLFKRNSTPWKNHCIGLLSLSWFRCLSVSLLFLWQCMHKCLPISFQGVFMNPIAPSFRWFYWSKMPLMNIFKMPTHYVNWIISAYSYMLKANTFINKFQLEPSHSPPFISKIPHSFELFEWIVHFWKLSVTKTSSE